MNPIFSAPNQAVTLESHGLASITLTLKWNDDYTSHEEQWHVEKFSLWREAELLPMFAQHIRGRHESESLWRSGDLKF
jgi:hypothetical protein